MKTIALFGGSFDPPHIGHEAIVKALLNFKDIDKVVVMPTFLNPFKSKSHAPSELRLQWLKCIFSPFTKVEINSYEVDLKEKTPTIQTVKYLLKKYKKIYLIVGADNLATLTKWTNYNELQNLVTFVVCSRDGINIPNSMLSVKIDEDVSSTDLRRHVEISKLSTECAQEIKDYYEGIN